MKHLGDARNMCSYLHVPQRVELYIDDARSLHISFLVHKLVHKGIHFSIKRLR